MYKWGWVACLLIVFIICSSGCTLPGGGKGDSGTGTRTIPATFDTPALPDQYVAQPSGVKIAVSPSATIPPTPGDLPAILPAAHTTIGGSGLVGGSTEDTVINETIYIITKPSWQDAQSKIVASAVDDKNPVTKQFALQWLRHDNTSFESICDMFDAVMDWDPVNQARYHVGDNWTYMTDQALYGVPDYWAPASMTIQNRDPVTNNLRGDCDDFAILNAAMVKSTGRNARLVYALSPSSNGSYCLGHMYAEAFVTDNSFISTVQHRYSVGDVSGFNTESGGYWVALDWFPDKDGFQHPGASLYDSTRGLDYFYPDGTWSEITPVDPGCTPTTQK